jgi:AAA+ ATPase superfamily predicted ATPase
MKLPSYDTVTRFMTGLKKLGYTTDFSELTNTQGLICQKQKGLPKWETFSIINSSTKA